MFQSLGRPLCALLGLLVAAGVALLIAMPRPHHQPERLLETVKQALQTGNIEAATAAIATARTDHADWVKATELVASAAVKSGRTAEAVKAYQQLAEFQMKTSATPFGLFYAAEAKRDAGCLVEAEGLYRQFLGFAPNHSLSHERLAFLMTISGRRWESVPHYLVLIKSGTSEVAELALFADLDRPAEQRPYLESCAKKAPNDRLVQLGLAADDFWQGRSDNALTQLQTIVANFPDSIAAQAMLGELLVNHSVDEFVGWHRALPTNAIQNPDIHFVRGLWARKQQQSQVAARCFWEALRLAPTHRRATMMLGQQLRLLNDPAHERVESRSKQLIQLTQFVDQALRQSTRRDDPLRDSALLLEKIGRYWEAAAWGIIANRAPSDSNWPQELFTRLGSHLTLDLPVVDDSQNFAVQLNFSSFPKFDSLIERSSSSPHRSEVSKAAKIRFEESGFSPEFVYSNGGDPATPGARIFEQTGGGVAVLDYDRDAWPDLFFPQGGPWRTGKAEPDPPTELIDRLYRNVDGRRPIDVTEMACLTDIGFGQGVAAGDYDNDGFPDLYVANVGRNQLLHNNGDGTFRDVTSQAGLTETDWTTSCAIVDLNADGHPDLFDVNYVTGPLVYEIICQGKACSPSVFAGAPDRLLINRGDGTFTLIPPQAPEIDGKGMGLIAFDLQERGRPNLFVANDQVPNFLLRNQSTGKWPNIQFRDEAFVSGVAFNQDGLAMASMGIAADDADGDGRLDLYVTTFRDEASLLLLQDAAGLFVDRTTAAGLRAATWPFVGWGTQFLDADRDGEPDLVGVNGHVDDFRDQGGEYHMRPQFFRNLGAARFEEFHADRVGPFFSQKRLGRGLSRVDWDRDGLMDFAVSNMGDRSSLVLNQTSGAGHFINVRLMGTERARDAIGSVIEVHVPDRVWKKQLVGGDGYMATNERVTQFGLGAAERIDELTVFWPSGNRSTVRSISVDRTLELIESSSRGIVRHGDADSDVIDVSVFNDR